MNEDEILASVGYVKAARNRLKVLKVLYKPQTPTEVGKSTGLGLNLASRALANLSKEGLVRCVNPDDKVGKIYKRTEKGENVLEHFKERL